MDTVIFASARRVAGALCLLALTACTGVYADLCEREAQCRGGNDADIDACVARAEGEEDAASAYDCSDPYDKVVDCLDRTGNCDDKDFESSCNDEYEALSNCEDAASAR
jgi:hypothetical protein